ncbi:MAG TPA: uroporphyrinogen-III synthase, partial [Acetobacteraceae bacterium]|nr:uroporphyrinogen-III synthase [Acetobacteraceae bacterium]
TRPEPGAAETAAAVAVLGWTPVLAPALVLAPLPPPRLPKAQAVLLPSRASARALGALRLPAFAVGEGTAAEARAQGCVALTAAEGDAAALAALVAQRLDPEAGPLLLAVGQGYGAELAAALRARGFRVIRRVVYAATPAPALAPEAAAALASGQVGAALFLSPRSAAITCRLILRAGLAEAARGIRALALSPRIAAALAPLPWGEVRAADRPDPARLLALLGPGPRAKPADSC